MSFPNYLYKNKTVYIKMHQNIKNNNVKSIDAKLYSAKYYDFMLYKGNTINSVNKLDEMSIIDVSDLDIIDGNLYSNINWSGATNNGVEMKDIGLTGIDNGLVSFRKDRITNAEFVKILTESKYNINANDKRFFLTPVTGNTQMYNYPMYIYNDDNEKYIACKGGFYQGFFKLHGSNYQVLPHELNEDWVFHFELRPRSEYKVTSNLVNYTHENNKGIFFFMGTRAENKFWPFYKVNTKILNELKENSYQIDGYLAEGDKYSMVDNYSRESIVYLENKWVMEEPQESNYFNIGNNSFSLDAESLNNTILKIEKDNLITCEDYFVDAYFDQRCPTIDNNKFVEEDYIDEGLSIDFSNFTDSEGRKITEKGFTEIETDNKFLMFDRTSSGFTTKNWVEGTKVTLTRRQDWPNSNYFMLMNRTKTGYTVNSIDNYNEEKQYDYNLYKDIRDNVFALRITDEGAIGYRYGVLNCDSDNKYELIEEYSKNNIIKTDEWNSINVRCTKISNNKMKLLFYVNGFLVFVSKDLKAFKFKAIDDVQEKQEGVPYNISIGGGSLGLLETILPDYFAILGYVLPIERDFCGTFMGDIKSFKMYEGFIDYSSIANYL